MRGWSAWDLSEIADLEFTDLEQIDALARKCNTLVVIIDAQPPVIRKLLSTPLWNVALG